MAIAALQSTQSKLEASLAQNRQRISELESTNAQLAQEMEDSINAKNKTIKLLIILAILAGIVAIGVGVWASKK